MSEKRENMDLSFKDESAGLRPNPHLLLQSKSKQKNQSHEATASATARSVVGGGEVIVSCGLFPTYFFRKKVSKKSLDCGEILSASNSQSYDNLGELRESQKSIGVLGGDSPLLSHSPLPFLRGWVGGEV